MADTMDQAVGKMINDQLAAIEMFIRGQLAIAGLVKNFNTPTKSEKSVMSNIKRHRKDLDGMDFKIWLTYAGEQVGDTLIIRNIIDGDEVTWKAEIKKRKIITKPKKIQLN